MSPDGIRARSGAPPAAVLGGLRGGQDPAVRAAVPYQTRPVPGALQVSPAVFGSSMDPVEFRRHFLDFVLWISFGTNHEYEIIDVMLIVIQL